MRREFEGRGEDRRKEKENIEKGELEEKLKGEEGKRKRDIEDYTPGDKVRE